ncbi:hypothetical protein LOD99_12862 [Oopsacas minuta]|uniref:Uncharacterized protein n=1 Tax=Oopsacas minuta TaxID=111878 RepID=A0AAV7JD78_9METZ|nr:hypothetical protein LOD99_12862 [Oopsacas minuta]
MFRGANISGFGTFQEINSTRGQLNLSIHEEQGDLIVFVSEARDLPVMPGKRSSQLNTYVKLYLIPDPSKKSKCKSDVVTGTRNPNFRRSFLFQLSETDRKKRLHVSIWQREMKRTQIGCMSFLVEEISLSTNGEVSGWFYLMDPGYGDERNFPVDANPRHSSVSQVPKGIRKSISTEFTRPGSAGERLHTRTVILKAKKGGFGLTLTGSSPPVISEVSKNSPASLEGLQKGDFILKVQETDTSKSTANHITTVLKACRQQVKLMVQRSEEAEVSKSQAAALHFPTPGKLSPSSYSSPPKVSKKKGKKMTDKELMMSRLPEVSTANLPRPKPFFATSQLETQMRNPIELDRQEAVRAVILLQRESVDFCRRAHAAYFEPLKSAHLTQYEHDQLFLPVADFLRISEAIQSNIDIKGRDYLTSTREGSPVVYLNVVGAIFTYDLEAMVKFFKLYNETKEKSLEDVARRREDEEFRNFLEQSHKKSGITIEEFFNFPGTYKSDLISKLREVVMNTPPKHVDFKTLHEVMYNLERLEQEQREEKDLDKKRIENLRELRDKISFNYNVEKFDICQDAQRRYIAEIELETVGKKREGIIMVLLSDMILICVNDPPYLCVKSNPIFLSQVMVHDVNCVDERDFQLTIVDDETLQYRAGNEKAKEKAKKMISERAGGATTLRSRVQAKRSFTTPGSPKEGGDIWEGGRKISTPNRRDGSALTFKSNLLPKEKDKYKKKPKRLEPLKEPVPQRNLQELMEQHPITGEAMEKWKEGLDSLLLDPLGVFYLKKYMQREFSEENLCFYIECREYFYLPESELIAKAEHIYDKYIKAGALTQINLDEQVLTELNRNMRMPKRDVFVRAQGNVFNLIKTDTYVRFIKSPIFDILPSEI